MKKLCIALFWQLHIIFGMKDYFLGILAYLLYNCQLIIGSYEIITSSNEITNFNWLLKSNLMNDTANMG